MKQLPPPDSFGNYWLGSSPKFGPAVFPSKYIREGKIARRGSYIALVSTDKGFIFRAGKLQHYKSPASALEAIVRELR
jgi:hypothetical protein